MLLTEAVKYVLYRLPFARRILSPRYPYNVNPGQLAVLVELINATKGSGALVAEIGVDKGYSSVFLLEHLRTTQDTRALHLFDTFSGFTPESIESEVVLRGKDPTPYGKFRYGQEGIFRRNLQKLGFDNFVVHKGDAAKVDWAALAPIGAVLLDIDVYAPTKAVLDAIWPHLASGGGVVLDDCKPDTAWDGSLQAYNEFITEHGLPFERAGNKGGVVRKP